MGTASGAAGFAAITALRRWRGEPAAGGIRIDFASSADTACDLADAAADTLPPAALSLTKRIWMFVLRTYLVAAVALVAVKVVEVAVGQWHKTERDDRMSQALSCADLARSNPGQPPMIAPHDCCGFAVRTCCAAPSLVAHVARLLLRVGLRSPGLRRWPCSGLLYSPSRR